MKMPKVEGTKRIFEGSIVEIGYEGMTISDPDSSLGERRADAEAFDERAYGADECRDRILALIQEGK